AAFLRGFALAALVTSIVVGTTGYALSLLTQNRQLLALQASLRTQNRQLLALRGLADKNAERANRKSDRLKDGVARMLLWQKRVIKNLPEEFRKDPLLRLFPQQSKKYIAITIRTSIVDYQKIVDEFPELTGLRSGIAALYHDQGQLQREIQQIDEAI